MATRLHQYAALATPKVPVVLTNTSPLHGDESMRVLDIDLDPEFAPRLVGQLPQDSLDIRGCWRAVLVPHPDVPVDRYLKSLIEQHLDLQVTCVLAFVFHLRPQSCHHELAAIPCSCFVFGEPECLTDLH